MTISRASNRFLMGTERSLSQKGIIKIWKNIPVQSQQVHKVFFFIIFIQNGIKRIRINLLVKREIHAATVWTAFSWFPWKQTSSYVKKSKFAVESWERRKVIQVIMILYLASIYLLKVNNRNTRTRCEICSKLTIKIPERRHWRRSGIFFVNFEHNSHLVLMLLLLTLNM